jgi:hypothetical protein
MQKLSRKIDKTANYSIVQKPCFVVKCGYTRKSAMKTLLLLATLLGTNPMATEPGGEAQQCIIMPGNVVVDCSAFTNGSEVAPIVEQKQCDGTNGIWMCNV